jgi:FdhD protein
MKIYKIIRISNNNNKELLEDTVTEEISLSIFVQNVKLTILLCSPLKIKDLVVGYLFTSGIIQKIEDIKKMNINIDEEKWNGSIDLLNDNIMKELVFQRIQPVGCGKGTQIYSDSKDIYNQKIDSHIKIEASAILSLMKDFKKKSEIFLKTGGVHSAALVDNSKIIVFREDIGRHNAIDKVIGDIILKKKSLDDKIIFTSGRISSEILLKIQRCRIPIIVSKGAPTNKAIDTCNSSGITLIGFARGNRMNIYSGEQRIIV